MSPQDLSTKQLYNEAEQILTLFGAMKKHVETSLMSTVHESWVAQFTALRLAVSKGDTRLIRGKILQIAHLLSQSASQPKLLTEPVLKKMMEI